jgi:hypothetical protein
MNRRCYRGGISRIPNWRVVGLPLPPKLANYGGVISRDVLRRWNLHYLGPRGRLTIRDRSSIWDWLAS